MHSVPCCQFLFCLNPVCLLVPEILTQFSFMILNLWETCSCQKSFPWIFLKMKHFCRNTFASEENNSSLKMTKDFLKMTIVKDWWKFIIMELIRKFCYFCGTQHFKIISRIMTDSIIPGHIRILGVSYNFQNAYINNIYSHRYNLRMFSITYLTVLPM